jgi:pimeloyl-ACP methyl ester carboxylesterase
MKNYDASQQALYQPELSATVFGTRPFSAEGICAELARLAYTRFENGDADEGKLRQALEAAGMSAVVTFATKRTGTQGFGAVGSDGKIYIAFRGTQADDPTDIGVDADLRLRSWKAGGEVHTGFSQALDSIWDAVAQWLKPYDPSKVWITGHSLGAALATLAASLVPGATLVTFGSPRVGDHAFAALFAQRDVRRYVDCSDVVTMVPPELLGYKHVGAIRYIDRNGEFQDWNEATPDDPIDDDRWEARAIYLAKLAWRHGNVGSRGLADHAPANYVRAF